MEEQISKPLVGIRNDVGNYDFDNDFGEEQERNILTTKEKSDNKSSLMAVGISYAKRKRCKLIDY